jgi:predicted metal-binding membrane protein
VAGYLAAWNVYGLAAYALFRFVSTRGTGWLAWNRLGPYAAAAAVAAAGVYELTR